jgi:hypothetical protein
VCAGQPQPVGDVRWDGARGLLQPLATSCQHLKLLLVLGGSGRRPGAGAELSVRTRKPAVTAALKTRLVTADDTLSSVAAGSSLRAAKSSQVLSLVIIPTYLATTAGSVEGTITLYWNVSVASGSGVGAGAGASARVGRTGIWSEPRTWGQVEQVRM